MNELLGYNIPNIQVYLNDMLITSNGSFEEHLAIIKTVLERLQEENLGKFYFAEAKTEYLGYEITRDDI